MGISFWSCFKKSGPGDLPFPFLEKSGHIPTAGLAVGGALGGCKNEASVLCAFKQIIVLPDALRDHRGDI